MNYLFWADGSASIGLGHLSRQKLIAHALADRSDAAAVLVTCTTADVLRPFEKGFDEIQPAPTQSDTTQEIELVSRLLGRIGAAALIIDKPEYPTDLCGSLLHLKRTHRNLAVVAFDAAAMPPGCVDLIVDANQRPAEAQRFSGSGATALFGPDYAVVAPEFVEAREAFEIREQLDRIVISMGGSDPNFVTALAIEAALALGKAKADVVLGPAFSNDKLRRLKMMFDEPRAALHQQATQKELAELLMRADACIVSGGITMFEAAAVGLPTLVISQNPKQLLNVDHLAERGAVVNLGLFSEVLTERITAVLSTLGASSSVRARLSKAAVNTVDGNGIARIHSAILELLADAE